MIYVVARSDGKLFWVGYSSRQAAARRLAAINAIKPNRIRYLWTDDESKVQLTRGK